MTLPFQIDGATTVIPGVYDTFRVQGSLPAPVPAGRSVCIFGEAEEGVPGSELDLRLNYYTDLQDVREFYKSGPIVDAARMLFTKQPAQVFGGAVQRLYVYKTNDSERAEKEVLSPANYGDLIAARYGERGNLIKSQIKSAQAETKPTKTFLYLPSPIARDYSVSVNGVVTDFSVLADDVASAFAAAAGAVAGLTATGGTDRVVNAASVTVDLTAVGDLLTITKTAGAGDFGTETQVGDVVYIPEGGGISGGSDENAGVYIVVSWSSTSAVLRQLRHFESTAEANVVAFDALVGATMAVGDLLANAPVVLTVSAATKTGEGACLEILDDTADKLGAGMMFIYDDLAPVISSSTAAIAKISASVPAAGQLTVSLSTSSFSSPPKVGDIVRIPRGSLIAGATDKNVGMMIVTVAGVRSVTLEHLFSGLTTEAVAEVLLAGETSPFENALGFVSTDKAAKKIDSSAEGKVKIVAARISDGEAIPESSIGGNVVLEIGYYNSAATACEVSIDAQRVMTISPTGTGLNDIVINTRKYKTLQGLVDILSAQTNVSARLPDSRYASLPVDVLDMVVDVGCLDGQSVAAHTGRIKRDYYDWVQFFEDNFGLLAFREGNLVLKAGLPAAEAAAGFLAGAAVGSTSNASIQAALDAALKVDVRQVVPLFSRDARFDVEDAITDPLSSYTIDSILAAVKAHVSTASGSLFKKERFGISSYDSDFSEAVVKVGELGYERMQLMFQRHSALDADGSLQTFLPWMASCAVAAGRSQSVLGTSMLRKPFLLSSADHVGQLSLYTDTLTQDFEPDDRGELEEAIASGLVVFRAVSGFGVRMESPDLSTRSRVNDPEGWVWERVNVLFTTDEVRQTVRSVLENFIGNRQVDTPLAVVRSAAEDALDVFLPDTGNGALESAEVLKLVDIGNAYKAQVRIKPTEALEAIILDVVAERAI